ncbi:unnamed protein product [Nyctereutes procyonoides]|uniref:(raccoon dog) hypothetical protein n=1 Tax=Nyctereutes procyonoides TaxID=34880 RepID=A0A811YG03_NYCPR|nr:unnamed protein product [Nyctereutes procyonoides]
MPEGYSPLAGREAGPSRRRRRRRRRRRITRPHSANTRVPPSPSAGRRRGPRSYPEQARPRGPPARGSRALGSPGCLRFAVLGRAPAARRLRFPPRQPAGRPRGARGGLRSGAPSSRRPPPAARRPPPTWRSRARGPGLRGSGAPGSWGAPAAPRSLPRGPSRGGASLAARGRHGRGARGHGAGVGPGAAGGGAAADRGTDAGAAARPLAMAPPRAGGSHLPSALPSPPDARRALPLPGPARPPARAATCEPPSGMLARRSAPGAQRAAARGPPCARPCAGQPKGHTGLPRAPALLRPGLCPKVAEDIGKTRRGL